MPNKTKQTRNDAKSAPIEGAYRPRPGKLALSLSAALALCIIGGAAIISLEMAAVVASLLALLSALYYENNKRSFDNQVISFKFKQLKDGQDKLTKNAAAQNRKLDEIKKTLKITADAQKAIAKKKRTQKEAQSKTSAEPKKSAPATNSEAVEDKPIQAAHEKDTDTQMIKRPKRPQYSNNYPPLYAKRGDAVIDIQEDGTPEPAPAPANYDPMADYESLSDMVVKELVHHAVENNQVDVFIQPIVRLPQRQTRFYEIFARIRAKPGMYLPASRYMKLAREDSLMNKIDHLLLMQCLTSIKNSAQVDNATPFFINITTATLSSALFMKQVLGFLSKNRDLAQRFVFEIKQSDFDNMQPAILEILRGLARLGCSMSIDHVEKMDFDLKFLQVLKVRFVKVNAAELIENTRTEKAFASLIRFKRKLEGNGIGFIAEKVEDEPTLKEILDFDIHYGQGYLFGRPDLQGAYKVKSA